MTRTTLSMRAINQRGIKQIDALFAGMNVPQMCVICFHCSAAFATQIILLRVRLLLTKNWDPEVG